MNPENLETIPCKNCGCELFRTRFVIKKAPAFNVNNQFVPSLEQMQQQPKIVAVQKFQCIDCLQIFDENDLTKKPSDES